MGANKFKFYLIACGTLIALLIIANIVMTPSRPPAMVLDEPLTNFDHTISAFTDISYTGALIHAPATLAIAHATFDPNETDIVLANLITQYNLEVIETDFLWTSANNEMTLVRNQQTNCYSLTLNHEIDQEISDWDTSTIINQARQFVNSVLGHDLLTPQTNHLTFYDASYHMFVSTINDSNAVAVPFAHTIDGIPVVHHVQDSFSFLVFLDNTYTPFRFDYCPQFLTLTITDDLPAISVQQAVANINHQPGTTSIISTGLPPIDFDPRIFIGGNLTSGFIQYRFNADTGSVIPMYFLSGVLFDLHGEPIEVDLITPAVNVVIAN